VRVATKPPYADKRRREHAEHGKFLSCKWCGGPMPGRRTSYCSDSCYREWYIRSSSSFARYHVRERDQGVCAQCGCDTDKLDRVIRHAIRSLRETRSRWCYQTLSGVELCGIMNFNYQGSTKWEMDHIVPVSEGGGGCGLDNLRTLCVPCHKKDSADLARKRAEQRSPQGSLRMES